MNDIRSGKLLLLLLVLSAVSLFIGISNISPAGLAQWSPQQWEIFMISRVPRLAAILISGASLAVCGLVMQQLSRNRFVSPTTAGTMDCARFGILLAMIFFPKAGLFVQTALSAAVAFIGTIFFMTLLSQMKFKDIVFVPLVGIMFGNIVSAVTAFIAYQLDLLQNLSGWLQGDFSLILSGRYEILYFSLPVMLLAYFFANRFSIVGMGEEFATNLGVNYQVILYLGLLIVSVATSLVIVTVGVIPFLGLIIPNIVSLIFGDNLRRILPFTALCGAIFVLICDIIGRIIIYPYEISINATVGVLGSLIFLYLLFHYYRHK